MRLVRKAKSLNQIPNYSFWRDFGALQAVGLLHILFIPCVLFSVACKCIEAVGISERLCLTGTAFEIAAS